MFVKKMVRLNIALLAFSIAPLAYASLTIPMYLVKANGQGKKIGTIKAEKADCGVLLTPDLHNLPSGIHGFHVHEKPSCADKAMAAGGHFDPKQTNSHEGPYRYGHLGDAPVLIVNQNGTATLPVLAPHFSLGMMKNHALIIHADGDNYADIPKKLGGGGARIACGIIPKHSS